MTNLKTVLAISGSTRQHSTNSFLINAIIELYKDKLDVQVSENISLIPHFNPDLDNENPPQAVVHFRKQLKEANGILLCTPEYAMGVPGTLKNAIDWTVSSMEFSHKPTALITASSGGEKGHAALLETLKVIEATIPDTSQLIISFVKTKVKEEGIADEKTKEEVIHVMDSLMDTMNQV